MIQMATSVVQTAQSKNDARTKQKNESAQDQSTFSSILQTQTQQATKTEQKNTTSGKSDPDISQEKSDVPATQPQQTDPTATVLAMGLQQILPEPVQLTVSQAGILQSQSQQIQNTDGGVGLLQSTELPTSQNNAMPQQSANYNLSTAATSTEFSVLTTAAAAQSETTDDAAENMPQGNRYGQASNVGVSSVKVDVRDGADVQTKPKDQEPLSTISDPSMQTTSSQPVQKQSSESMQTAVEKMNVPGLDDSESQTDDADKNSLPAQASSLFRMNTASETIKVSDASSEIAKPVASQITQEIKANISADNSEFTMRLSPKELGELTVKMTSKDGILTVELIAADPKTQHLLSERAGEIQTAIQSSQEKQIHISCPTQQTDNQDLFKQSDSQSNQQRQQEHAAQESNEETFASTESFLSMLQQMDLLAM